MPIDGNLLTLSQWLSPAFPLGAFTYSHGLETAIEAGWVHDAISLQDWLEDLLEHGSGRTDAIWIRAAMSDGAHWPDLDALARAYSPAAERLREADKQGGAFVKTVNAVWFTSLPALVLPLALGAAAQTRRMDADTVVALYLNAFVGNLVSAAQRLMPFGQTQAQQVLSALTPLCLRVTATTRPLTPDDLWSNAFLSDISAMKHETLQHRLFQS
ncbi:urease accessory protein UreF [Pelagimonas varians]|uniref:Urease accessory protein UreF n=1 Tax=Pelagimonas varians TaxID=696760 RepID=A0A238K0B1_9RHOB|nr:urease accessory UreF family protein [Pelagimonas varians]PYG33321.1 urease accessory protein [Pelagimonas varians]SMX36351.1 Urease accessory protein UreF [Pelagimonas varians]